MAANMGTSPDNRLVYSLKLFSRGISVFVALVGLVVLMGWVFSSSLPKAIGHIVLNMKANSAVSFILSGISLWILANENSQNLHRIARIFSIIVALVGFLTVGEYLLGKNFGIDQLFFKDSQAESFPGRMAPTTAFNFLLVGLSLFSLDKHWLKGWFNDTISIIALFISILAVIGYIYDISSFYQLGIYSSIAVHTAASFALLSLAILFARPERGLMKNIIDNSLGGTLARRLLPAAFIIPFIIGWLCLSGQLLGFYDVMFGFALFALANVISFSALIWWNAGLLNRVDHDRKKAGQAFLESEARYRHTLDAMLEGCQIIGFDWRYIYLNDVADQHNRRPKEELIGKRYMDMWPGIETTEVFRVIKKCMDEREAQSMENNFIYPSGSQAWFELRIYPVPEGIVILSLDITERKRAEEQLIYQANLLSNVNDAIIAADKDYNITYWNHAAESVYGWRADEILHRNGTDILKTQFPGATRETMLQSIRETGYWRGEATQLKKDGTRFSSEISTFVLYDESENVTGYISVNRDVTERKLAEEALHESNINARSLLHLSRKLEQAQTYSDALNAALDEVKHILGYNNVWTYLLTEDKQQFQLLNISGGKLQTVRDEFLTLKIKGDRFLEEISDGKDIVIVEDARTDHRTNKEIVKQLGNRTIVNVPIIFMDKQLGVFGTGTFGDEGVRIPTPTQMDYLRALSSHMAVTLDRIHLLIKRKEVEEEIRKLNESLEERIAERTSQLEAANKELEAFSYSVSHDLRSPLRGIDGWSLALLEDYGGMLDEQGQAHIQRVRDETQRMGMLIDDILQLSRITRAEINKEKVDMSAIAKTVVARIQEIKPKDRQVEFVIQDGLTAMGDPKLLDVVFTNLIGNSFKFTSKKQNASIEFGQTIIEGERAFFVRDNGAGFDMTYASKLFGAFQRMHRVSEFPGTGVGLATVQRIIHRHGGSIWASSEVDQGATFYFTLEETK